MDLIHFLAALLGLSFLIFIHELGHFLAAKKVGIRVEAFCIGFQPTIFGHRARFFAFTRGDTEYALGMVPFGGYVKMAGEELTDEKTGAGDEFGAKGVGERALVLVAGSVMNILLGLVLFAAAFTWGFDSESTVVGTASVGGPAWEAGIRSGDKITAVNGEPVVEYLELATKVALSGTDGPLEISLERPTDDGITQLEYEVTPRKDPVRGLPFIGVGRARTLEIGYVEDDSAADEAGLNVGDQITSVTLEHGDRTWIVPTHHFSADRTWALIVQFVGARPDGVVQLGRSKADGTPLEPVRLTPTVSGAPPEDKRPRLGVSPRSCMIRMVQPQTEAAEVLRAGMMIAKINGQPMLAGQSAFDILENTADSDQVQLEMATGESVSIARLDLVRWVQEQVVIGSGSNKVASVEPGSAAAALGLAPGAYLQKIGDKSITGPDALAKALEADPPLTVEWWDGAAKSATLTQTGDTFGVKLDTAVTIGSVQGQSPAAKAGLLPGDVVTRINDVEVREWKDLIENVVTETPPAWYQFFRKRPYFTAEEVTFQVMRDGAPLSLNLTAEFRHPPSLGLGAKAHTTHLKSGIAEACVLGPKRGWVWTMRVFMTLKSLVKRDVSMKNLSGPVGIFAVGTAASKKGFGWYLFILAVISINLGIFNLLPFPILDGGHLAFLAVEKIKGSPVSERVQIWAFNIAFILLISLALFVTYNDILRLLGLD